MNYHMPDLHRITDELKIAKELAEQSNERAQIAKQNALTTGKYIDLSYLMQRTKYNPVLLMEMISLYLEQTPPLVLAMKQSMENKDWNVLYSTVHKMIPSFSIIGINRNFEIMAKKVQEYARTQQQTDVIAELVLQLEKVCMHACKELEVEYQVLKNTKL